MPRRPCPTLHEMTRKHITVRVADQTKKQVEYLARVTGHTKSQVLRDAIAVLHTQRCNKGTPR
jgi:predicted transcriptional regulator